MSKTITEAAAEARADALAAANALTDEQIVAARTADTDEASAGEHVKVFVLPPGPKPTEANGFDHAANIAAVRQYMMSQGLRPTGDVRHVSTKPFGPGGKSWALTYAVPAVPAERFNFAAVHVVVDDEQHEGDGDTTGGATDPAPTMSSNRATIDAYAASKGIDTTGAANKREALALIPGTEPTA